MLTVHFTVNMKQTTLFLSLLLIVVTSYAQSRDEIEKRLRSLQDQMTVDVMRINEAEEAERASLQTLTDIERQLKVRQEMISTNELLVQRIQQSRDSMAASIRELETELRFHKNQYQTRAIHAYKYGRLHDVALIMASESINQMLIRIRYLDRFASERRDRLVQINSASEQILSRRKQMDEDEIKAQELIGQYREEQENFKELQQTRTRMVSQLQQQKASLQRELEDRQRSAEELETRIRRLIAAENSRRASAPVNAADAAENARLSSSFSGQRGSLPWPSEGAIVEKFGNVTNAVYGTVTSNPGILISTPPSAEVSSVYEGEVVEIYTMPEFGRVVTISHGDFTCLYGNLSMIYVAQGTKVTSGQMIGRAGTAAEPKENGVFFALFENGIETDPEDWLSPR